MPFFKITYNQKYRFATLHNFGCTFRCGICSYRLRSGADGRPGQVYPKPERFLAIEQMKTALRSVSIDKVLFMGGEPTVAQELPAMLDFAKNALGAKTYLGHTNGSRLPLANLNGANVGLKAWDDQVHLRYTGRPRQPIFNNFAAACRAGLEMKANMVFIPAAWWTWTNSRRQPRGWHRLTRRSLSTSWATFPFPVSLTSARRRNRWARRSRPAGATSAM